MAVRNYRSTVRRPRTLRSRRSRQSSIESIWRTLIRQASIRGCPAITPSVDLISLIVFCTRPLLIKGRLTAVRDEGSAHPAVPASWAASPSNATPVRGGLLWSLRVSPIQYLRYPYSTAVTREATRTTRPVRQFRCGVRPRTARLQHRLLGPVLQGRRRAVIACDRATVQRDLSRHGGG